MLHVRMRFKQFEDMPVSPPHAFGFPFRQSWYGKARILMLGEAR